MVHSMYEHPAFGLCPSPNVLLKTHSISLNDLFLCSVSMFM